MRARARAWLALILFQKLELGRLMSYVARALHLCGRTRLGYLSGTKTPWVLVGDVS
ncbi:hypothetical protein Hanom_Chr12g01065581 [Helianthus anomalus]